MFFVAAGGECGGGEPPGGGHDRGPGEGGRVYEVRTSTVSQWYTTSRTSYQIIKSSKTLPTKELILTKFEKNS